MNPRSETFQHTADVGIRVYAPSLPELLIPASKALYQVIGELSPQPDSEKLVPFSFSGQNKADLYRDFLAELLFRFESNRLMLTGLAISRFDDEQLAGTMKLSAIEEGESIYDNEIKAVTYHELSIEKEQDPSGAPCYIATVIVDL